MQRRESQGVHWLEFDLLTEIPGLVHAIFLRHGGYSRGNLSSLNFGSSVGDDPSALAANFKLAAQMLNLPALPDRPSQYFHSAWLTHGACVKEASLHHTPSCDGITTQQSGMPLIITHADCQVALFYDPIQKAIANVHCGWRGSVQNIYAHAVEHMQNRYGSKPQDLLVGIGPSLGPESAQFLHYQEELPESFWEFQIKPFYFDFWAISAAQLQACGVLPHHMEIARIDTYQNQADCFSYRRDKPTGRHGTAIAILPPK